MCRPVLIQNKKQVKSWFLIMYNKVSSPLMDKCFIRYFYVFCSYELTSMPMVLLLCLCWKSVVNDINQMINKVVVSLTNFYVLHL